MLSGVNPTNQKINYITSAIFMLCNGFTKLSLLTFYLRLSPQKWWRVAVWGSIVIVALYTSIIALMIFFQCDPVRKAYDVRVKEGKCLNAGALYIATAGTNVVTDLILFVLPVPMVYRLRLGWAQKMGALLIFGIGSMYVIRYSLETRAVHGKRADWTQLTVTIQDTRNIRCTPCISPADTYQYRPFVG